jgi:hypothetical protein
MSAQRFSPLGPEAGSFRCAANKERTAAGGNNHTQIAPLSAIRKWRRVGKANNVPIRALRCQQLRKAEKSMGYGYCESAK